MTYIAQNIKRQDAGSGAAAPNQPNITFVRAEDVLVFPPRDANGVLMVGNFSLVPGAKMFTVYGTPSKQSKPFTTEGDEDMESIKQTFEFSTPGDSLKLSEYVQNNLGVGHIIIANNCVDGYKRVYGTPCSPMKLKADKTDDSSGRMIKSTWEQITATQYVPAFYEGVEIFAEATATDEDIDFTQANGSHYQLPAYAATVSITAASIDHDNGALLTVLGGGGADPATLANGASTAATFILKGGTAWTALQDASITFKVIDDGATTYLVEQSRS